MSFEKMFYGIVVIGCFTSALLHAKSLYNDVHNSNVIVPRRDEEIFKAYSAKMQQLKSDIRSETDQKSKISKVESATEIRSKALNDLSSPTTYLNRMERDFNEIIYLAKK